MLADAPPRDSVWDRPVDRVPWAFFDLEMTGLDPARDAIVEIAVLRVTPGQPMRTLTTRIATDVPMTDAASRVHGLEPSTTAPRFGDVANTVADLLSDAVGVGHGVEMDLEFLARAFAATSVVVPRVFALDTLTLARRAISARSYTLSALTASLGLPERQWHRAREDALAVRALFDRLVPAFAPSSPRDLWEVRVGQRRQVQVRQAIAARLEALAVSEAPTTLVTRTRGSGERRIRGVIERYSPPHTRVRDANGGVSLVRADRILRIEGR